MAVIYERFLEQFGRNKNNLFLLIKVFTTLLKYLRNHSHVDFKSF